MAGAAVLAVGAIDLAWNQWAGLAFTGWGRILAASLATFALAIFYSTVRRRPTLAEMAGFALLWILFSAAGGIQTYLAAAAAQPLMDDSFARLDQAMGFDWVAWTRFVRERPRLNGVLRLAYLTLMAQILVSLVLFALLRVPGRNAEMLLGAAIAILLTSAISALLPALGPWVHFGFGAMAGDTIYVPHVQALRTATPPAFEMAAVQGIVCLPSYHTVLGLIFVHAHRGLRWSFWPFAAVNAVMLLSLPSEGGHYLVDILAGAATGILAILAARTLVGLTPPRRS